MIQTLPHFCVAVFIKWPLKGVVYIHTNMYIQTASFFTLILPIVPDMYKYEMDVLVACTVVKTFEARHVAHTFGRLRQEEDEFKASRDYNVKTPVPKGSSG